MVVVRPDWNGANTLSQGAETYAPPDRPVGNLEVLIRHIAGASMDDIDSVIRELESLRAMLRNEGERVSREIASYAGLSRASMTAMKAISDSIKKWKDTNKAG